MLLQLQQVEEGVEEEEGHLQPGSCYCGSGALMKKS